MISTINNTEFYRRKSISDFKYPISNIVCLNCEKKGHAFKQCKYPINSYGIIAYKRTIHGIKFLLIQRKDTIGFIDFVRGKYSNTNDVKLLVEEMTENEKSTLVKLTFRNIWNNMWYNKKSSIYINDYATSIKKYKLIDIYNMINGSCPSKFTDTEFGFPKGRKNKNESRLECAVREFREETGYETSEIIIQPDIQFSEVFYGTNTLVYKHTYFLAELITDKQPHIHKNNRYQLEEIKSISLKSFKESVNLFFSSTKRSILYKVRKHLQDTTI